MRVERKSDEKGGERFVGRISASAPLPPGARLLVPRSALGKEKGKEKGRSSSASPASSSSFSPLKERRREGNENDGSDDGGENETEPRATLALARLLRSRLLFSGPGFCVLDKPPGVHVQGGSRKEAAGATLDAAAAAAARKGWLGRGMSLSASSSSSSSGSSSSSSSSSSSGSNPPPLAARLVHRVDAPVSGAIAVAGDANTAARLARAFAAPSSALLAASEEGKEEDGEGDRDDRGGGGGGGGLQRRRRRLSSFLSPCRPPPSSPPPSRIEISKTYLAIVDCVPYGTLLSSFGESRGEGSGSGSGGEGGKVPGPGKQRRQRFRGTVDGPLPLSPVAGGAASKAAAHARAAAGSAAPPARPPRAATAWRLLAADAGGGWALLALSPLTGRRHQLRKHCAGSFGSPVAGDERYGATRSPRGRMVAAVAEEARRKGGKGKGRRGGALEDEGGDWDEEGEGEERLSSSSAPSCSSPNLMLYCSSLTIRAPEGGVTVRARPPEHFEALARRLGWGRLLRARRRAAARAPATAAGEWGRWREEEEEDFSSNSHPSELTSKPRCPRRAPRAGRRPGWAL